MAYSNPPVFRMLLCTMCMLVVLYMTPVRTQSLDLDLNSFGGSSSYGNEFFVGFMRNFEATRLTELELYIGTPAITEVQFVVESMDYELIYQGAVTAGEPARIKIPVEFQVLESTYEERRKGLHIYTVGNSSAPIFVLGANFFDYYNYATFLVYPYQQFEIESYEYLVTSVGDTGKTLSQILLVGADDDTIVTVSPSQNVLLPQDVQIPSSPLIAVDGGGSHQFTLHQLQTLLIAHPQDLTGTRIVSNRPLTVISGHECANVPIGSLSCEHLAVQIPPTATWGSEFLLAGFAGRESKQQQFRIVASEEDTTFVLTCNEATLSQTFQSVFDVTPGADNKFCYLQSDKPVFVTQFALGETTDFLGDPAIAVVSPIDQYISEIDFLTLPASEFPTSYVSVTVSADLFNPTAILLDGDIIECNWQPIYNSSDRIVGYGCDTTLSNDPTQAIQHTLTHSNIGGQLSATVYGFSNFPRQGYAYLAGQRLSVNSTTDGVVPEIIIMDDSLEYFDLETFPGVQQLERVEDSVSQPIPIPDGLLFGDHFVGTVFVNENGVLSFNKPWKFSHPERFPTSKYEIRSEALALAVFWSDIDIRKSGAVRYVTASLESTDEKELDLLDQVNDYVNLRIFQSGEVEFRGTWLLVVHWDTVHPSPHGDDNHLGVSENELEKSNNFQAVIITNVTHTYYVFNYKCGELQWSGVGDEHAVVGYIVPGRFRNHPSSGYSSIAQAVSCSAELKRRRRKRISTKNSSDVRSPQCVDLQNEQIRQCLDYDADFGRNNLISQLKVESEPSAAVTAESLSSTLLPCPRSESDAIRDHARFVKQSDSPLCYVTSNPKSLPEGVQHPDPMIKFALTQQCCYDDRSRNLVTSTDPSSYAGTLLLFHPLIEEYQENYRFYDEKYRRVCQPSDGMNSPQMPQSYFRNRPINDGTGYTGLAQACGSGDPHYSSFDAYESGKLRKFDFQGKGDYLLLESKCMDGPDGDESPFQLQGRLDRRGFSEREGVTWHRALAFGQQNRIAFHVESNPTLKVYMTVPDDIDITNYLIRNGQTWNDAQLKVTLTRRDPYLYASFHECGIVVRIRPSNHYVDFCTFVPQDTLTLENLRGFFGIPDGDPYNDYRDRNGNQLPNINNEQDLYRWYNFEWSLNPLQSLFRGSVQRSKRQSPDEDYEPLFFNDLKKLNFTDEQVQVCENNRECLFDLVATNDMEVAMTTLDAQNKAEETKAILDNTPPTIESNEPDSIFRVNVGTVAEYRLFVSDQDDTFDLTVLGGLPEKSNLDQVSDGEYIFTWELLEPTNNPLVFVATDSLNASSSFIPTVEICACENDGVCTTEGVLTSNSTVIMKCLCDEAFSGQFCEEDRNGCSEQQCFEGVECFDRPAPSSGVECGPCPPGFTGDGLKCYDIDECETSMEPLCEQLCVNTEGGYYCDCEDGYVGVNATHCGDINECTEGLSGCQQECTNMEGSYVCSCVTGFTLSPDGRNCTVDRPCQEGHGCSHICAEIDGANQCFCPLGYELSTQGGTTCIDVDECVEYSVCDQVCVNTMGLYQCTCDSGYELTENGRLCQDIDECELSAFEQVDLCEEEQNSQCVNTDGSYMCSCVPGYSRQNGTCQRLLNILPPPPPAVIMPELGIENSVTVNIPSQTFTPDRQQLFRRITADLATKYCGNYQCAIALGDGDTEIVSDVAVSPKNIALLIDTDEMGAVSVMFYVQLREDFLLGMDLQQIFDLGADEYRNAGFLEQEPPTTAAPTTEMTTTSQPTTTEKQTTPPTTTDEPTTAKPTTIPTTSKPTTIPTTAEPTTIPTTAEPTTVPTTAETTTIPTTAEPTTITTTTERPSEIGLLEPDPDVYFRLNGQILANNSEISIRDIGEGRTALHCVTKHPTCCRRHRAGDFYLPGRVRVTNQVKGGFYQIRRRGYVRLNRRLGVTRPTGRYHCRIPNERGRVENIFVNVK